MSGTHGREPLPDVRFRAAVTGRAWLIWQSAREHRVIVFIGSSIAAICLVGAGVIRIAPRLERARGC